MPTVRLRDFEMFVECRGEGEPLLLLHGGMGIGADHVHGDAQLRQLYAMTASFATRDDDMAFTASTLGPIRARIRARTLIVQGDRDPLYPIELALELYRGIPTSELWVVPGGGHESFVMSCDSWRSSRVVRPAVGTRTQRLVGSRNRRGRTPRSLPG
jgi:hypothetical protein